MQATLIILTITVVIIIVTTLASDIARLFHRIIKGHWPEYKYYGYDKYGFDLYSNECDLCLHDEQGK